MPHIIEFSHPIKRDEYELHTVPGGTNLAEWVKANKPASAALQATVNCKKLENLDVVLGEFDAVSLVPRLGFGIDWVIWAALAASVAAAAYAYSQTPDTGANRDTQQASSVYNYNGQGNQPKLGNPVPVQYGRMPHYPDIIAPSWWEYVDNEQYYYQTFSKGVGNYLFHGHYIGETPLSKYSRDIEVRAYQPGELVDHFPHIVWTSKEVGSADGQGGLTLAGVTSDWVSEATSQEVRFRNRENFQHVVELWQQKSSTSTQHHGDGDRTTTTYTWWEKQTWPWSKGQHIVISSAAESVLLFEGNLTFIDKGDDGDVIDPQDLPDQIENVRGWDFVDVGQRIIVTGAGVNSGTFVVAKKVSTTRIEVNNESGEAVTSFEPMSNVFSRVHEATTNDGTYVCKDDSGSVWLVDSDTLEEITDWIGFLDMDSTTATLSVLEKDLEAQWVGDFLSVPSDAVAQDVGLDFLFPRGLGEMNNHGDIINRSAKWEVRVRPAGSNDAYQTHTFELTQADNTPQRKTYWLKQAMGLAPGRYEIGARRISLVTDSTKVFDEVQWMGLKAVIQNTYRNDHETIITLKIKATNALSQQANQQYWNDSTRVLAVRQTNGTYVEQPTRSPADAVIDACRNAVYGSGLNDDAIDIDTFLAYRDIWQGRGDYCDGLFDQPTAFWDALGTLLLTGRGYPRLDFGTVSMWRDEPRTTLCKPYSPVNTKPDSFTADTSLPEDDEYDGVELEWFNPASRKSETYLATVGGQPGYNPKPLKMPFITTLGHAQREGVFHAAVQAYRRTHIDMTTDLDGWESNHGDVVPVAHDAVEWGQSGQVLEKLNGEDGNQYLQLTGLLEWEAGKTHYILFNHGNNAVHGPYRVEPTTADDIVVLVDPPEQPIYAVGERGQKPSEYMFGPAGEMYRQCILMRVQQKGEFEVGIKAVEDDPRVHAYA